MLALCWNQSVLCAYSWSSNSWQLSALAHITEQVITYFCREKLYLSCLSKLYWSFSCFRTASVVNLLPR